jgi:hypothetical protein
MTLYIPKMVNNARRLSKADDGILCGSIQTYARPSLGSVSTSRPRLNGRPKTPIGDDIPTDTDTEDEE